MNNTKNGLDHYAGALIESPLGSSVEFRFGPPVCGFEWKWITEGMESGEPVGISDLLTRSRLLVMKGSDTTWRGGYRISDPRVQNVYCEFGQLEPTEEAISDFACRYGPLGTKTYSVGKPAVTESQMRMHGPSWPTPRDAWREYPGRLGENLEEWKECIANMRVVLDLSEALALGSRKKNIKLKKWIRITKKTIELRHPSATGKMAAYQTKEGEYPNAARRVIGRIANKALLGATALAFSSDPRGNHGLQVEYRTVTLLGALWIQFLDQAIEGSFKRCHSCGTIYPVGIQGRRVHSKFCSGTCRVRAHRQSNR